MVLKILGCVPKLLKYVKIKGRQLRVRFMKGISLSEKIKKVWKERFLLAVSILQLDDAVKWIPCTKPSWFSVPILEGENFQSH